MRPPEFYQRHLDAVSRTFALCIPRLDPPFRERVALSYLLLRVLDTVEDAPFADRLLQQRQFNSFRQFLQVRPTLAQIDAFRSSFPAALTDGERALLADTEVFVEDAYELPAAAREVVFGAIGRMAQGMALYAQRPCMSAILVADDFESLLLQSADDFQTEIVWSGTLFESGQGDATISRELDFLDC